MGRFIKIAKFAGRVSGVLKANDDGTPVKARATRLVATTAIIGSAGIGLVVSLLVRAGVPPEVAARAGDLLDAILAAL